MRNKVAMPLRHEAVMPDAIQDLVMPDSIRHPGCSCGRMKSWIADQVRNDSQ
jgi:hypothetical protein